MPDRVTPSHISNSATFDTALVIMARYPKPGATKTRLARSIGNATTIDLYKAFLADLALKFADSPANQYDLHWFYTPFDVDYAALISTLTPATSMRFIPQQGKTLGKRLHHAFRVTHRQGYQQTVLIGSDSPHIRTDIVAQARVALDHADVVLGPAEDGGYYLIAMSEPHDVFSGIPMSTAQVLHLTIDLARQQGLRVSLLETLLDIDELPDLLRLSNILRADKTLAPATAAQLDTIL